MWTGARLCEADVRTTGISAFYGFAHDGAWCVRLSKYLEDTGDDLYRDPAKGELVIGIYRADESCDAALLYAGPLVYLFWESYASRM